VAQDLPRIDGTQGNREGIGLTYRDDKTSRFFYVIPYAVIQIGEVFITPRNTLGHSPQGEKQSSTGSPRLPGYPPLVSRWC